MVSSLPEAERQKFMSEAVATLRDCIATGNFATFAELVVTGQTQLRCGPTLTSWRLQGDVTQPVNEQVDVHLGS